MLAVCVMCGCIPVVAGETLEAFIAKYPEFDKLKAEDAAKAHAEKLLPIMSKGKKLTIELVSGRKISGRYQGMSEDHKKVKLGHRWIPVTDIPGRYLIQIDPGMHRREQGKIIDKYMARAKRNYERRREAAIQTKLKEILASPKNLGTVERKIIYDYEVASVDVDGVNLKTPDGELRLRFNQIAKIHRNRFKTGVNIKDLEGKEYNDVHVLDRSDKEVVFYDADGEIHKFDPRFLPAESRKALGYEVNEEPEELVPEQL